jgi:hypothetical protein
MIPRFDLNAYISHCHVLLRDVRHALWDCRVRKAGWTLHYAVDFSEIYSYVMPGDSHERAPIGDGWSNDVERQFYVLSRFFGERNILLPEPYAVELAGFVDLIAAKEFTTSSRTYLRTRQEVLKTLATSQTREILDRMRRAENEPLTEDELDRYFDYFEKNTPNLVAFARGLDLTPFGRLKDLLLQRTFKALEREYPQAVVRVDEERTKRRFALLSKLRSLSNPAANVIDARALGEVEAVNELLVPARKRVLLVSRSAHLMSVAEAEAGDREVFVRHPRTVSTAYLASPSGVLLADEAELQIREQSLHAFISGAEEAQNKLRGIDGMATEQADILNIIDDSTRKTLRQLLERIQSEWRNVEAFATGLTKAGETRKKKGSRKEVAIELLTLLRDPTKLRSRMVDHIQQIFREVRRDRDRVAFRLQRDTYSHGSIDYPIEFQDSDLRIETEKLSAAWTSNLADAETLFEVAIRCESDYECLLGIAISLGALGRWPLAKQYVDYGLVSRPPGQRREGLFLQGVMAKRMSFEKQSLSEAQERMQDALESVDAAVREHGGHDPRYLNERARLKLWLIEFARSPEGAPRSEQNETPIVLEDVISDLNQAVLLASGKLKIQILNSLCYAHLLSEDLERLPEALDLLRSALTTTYPDRSKWPPFALDTVVYTMYRLQRSHATLRTLKGWSEELTTVLEQADVSSQERRLIGAHASEIAEYQPTDLAN